MDEVCELRQWLHRLQAESQPGDAGTREPCPKGKQRLVRMFAIGPQEDSDCGCLGPAGAQPVRAPLLGLPRYTLILWGRRGPGTLGDKECLLSEQRNCIQTCTTHLAMLSIWCSRPRARDPHRRELVDSFRSSSPGASQPAVAIQAGRRGLPGRPCSFSSFPEIREVDRGATTGARTGDADLDYETVDKADLPESESRLQPSSGGLTLSTSPVQRRPACKIPSQVVVLAFQGDVLLEQISVIGRNLTGSSFTASPQARQQMRWPCTQAPGL
ncbi:hypothetical protein MC885_010898 [Smutsia gigantea]|nr:hypothetical protein MC885_010898 [Smutsia gigantea]